MCHLPVTDDQPTDRPFLYGNPGSDCDSPLILLQETFEYLKHFVKTHDIDAILWTGDTGRFASFNN